MGRHAGREDLGYTGGGQAYRPRGRRTPRTPDRNHTVQPYSAADLYSLAAATSQTGVLTSSKPVSVARTFTTGLSGATHVMVGNVLSEVRDLNGVQQQLLGLIGVRGELASDGQPQQEIGAAIIRAIVPFEPNGQAAHDCLIWTRPPQPVVGETAGADPTFRSYWDGTFVLDLIPGSRAVVEVESDVMGLHVGEVVVPNNTGGEDLEPVVSVASQDGQLEVFQGNPEFDPHFAEQVGSYWAADSTILRTAFAGSW